jgi:hypothetical protein
MSDLLCLCTGDNTHFPPYLLISLGHANRILRCCMSDLENSTFLFKTLLVKFCFLCLVYGLEGSFSCTF